MERDFFTIHLDSLDGVTADPNYILEISCKPVSHKFAFDYEQVANPVANHEIVVDIDNVLPYNRSQDLDEKALSTDTKEEIDMK
jgi:hypothetical protein